ncbi:MAG: hypothetical protein KDB63_04420 [Nocardioidaceae bacterium]|nr:hypothetical protein [Nocardioidaceae bacterium]
MPLAHGIGGARDLPISAELAVAAGVAALVVSFTVLALAWRTPRYVAPAGRPVPAAVTRVVDATATRWLLRGLGLLLTAYTMVALWGGQDRPENPVFGMFYVLLWVGLVPASLLLGPVWRAISPFHLLVPLARRPRGWPRSWGLWLAAMGLYAFVWMELANPHGAELGALRLWIIAYVAAMVLGTLLFGEPFLAAADPFEVYSSLVARLSPWGRRDGRLVLRSPLANLATTPASPGLVAVVAVLFGSTAFDTFKDSATWLQAVQGSDHPVLWNNLGLLGGCLLVGGVLVVATSAAGSHARVRRRDLPRLLAHSVIPIVVGYVVAHYLSFLVGAGQLTLIRMSDPLSNGSNLFGTADGQVGYWLARHPTLLALVKVLGVVAGHIVGVVAAHDRSLTLLPRRYQLTGQLPLLFAMVGFTAGGLWLLLAA